MMQTQSKKLNFRPLEATQADYEHLARIHNAAWPEYARTADAWRRDDKHWDARYLHQRLLVELDGRPVAFALYCEPSWSYKPGKHFVDCTVHPDFRGSGLTAAIYDHLEVLLVEAHNSLEIVTDAREDERDKIALLVQRGFEFEMRFPESKLDVERFDFARFSNAEDRLTQHGLVIRSLAQLEKTDPEWPRKLHALICTLLKDVPSPDPITPEPFEQFQRRLDTPTFCPQANFVALDGDRYVGYSALWLDEMDVHKLNTGLSGVLRSHRRKGVCTALKVRGIAFAKAHGATSIITENEEHNPMYQLNLQLGFRPEPAWCDYHKRI